MTAPIPPIKAVTDVRAALAAATTQQTAAKTSLATLLAQQAALLRKGDTAGAKLLETKITAARTTLDTATKNVANLNAQLVKASDGLLVATTPESLVATLDGRFPITMLPVRLEARYVTNASALNVRIYPDQIHIDGHERELTAAESQAGMEYWRARWTAAPNSPPSADSPWAILAGAFGARRAAWIAFAMTPTNMTAIGTATQPTFPTVPARASNWTRAARATVLPDRWAIVGIRGGRAVFRKWTNAVPDSLAATISPDESTPAAVGDIPLVDADSRWIVDFAEATRVGMGVTIGAADLVAGYSLAQGVDRLVAIGVDWTVTPADAAAALEALVTAHHFTDGISFLAQGVPTNNTSTDRAGAAVEGGALLGRLDPSRGDVIADLQDASADRLGQALGVAATARLTLRRAPGAELREAECASRMFDALWESTLGYYLTQFMRPNLTDAMITTLRDHAVKFVAPFGPFAPLRIGKQPYGVLPVVASSRYKPTAGNVFETKLADLTNKARALWIAQAGSVPRMGRSNDPSKDILEVLQATPQSSAMRFRYIYGPTAVKNTQGLATHAAAQELVLRTLGQYIAWPQLPELVGYTADTHDYPLNVPLIAPAPLDASAPLATNYIKQIAALTRAPGSYDALRAREDASTILETLLAHAAERELHAATMRRVEAFRLQQGAIIALPSIVAMRTPETVAVEPTTAPTTANTVAIDTPGDAARLVIPTLSGTKTVRDDIAAALSRNDILGGQLRTTAQFLSALDWLGDRSQALLDRAARGVLDACSFRLDAWLTSLASRRLADIRAARPTGTHIGGYGWLDDLKPSPRPDSLGYVHAPSISHATTAAILRSGHLAHHDAEHVALNIDLSSDRVRLALHLLEGTAQGQPLAALLGYRFERNLRQRGLSFAKFIYPIRQLAPLRSTGEQPAPGVSVESVAARDVVDGVALLERWRTQRSTFFTGITATAAEQQVIGQELDALAATYDAVSDLLLAESVHQLALGNTERAGATIAATDAQQPAPSPAVVRTPRTGRSYSQRVAVVLSSDTMPAFWPATLMDVRARAEPRLNAWLGAVLGDPARIRLAVQIENPNGIQEVKITDLGLSPLSLVLASEDGSEGRASELEERVAQRVASSISAPTPATSIRLLDTPPAGATSGTLGLGALRPILGWLRALISEQRALDARDFSLPQDLRESGVDATDIGNRSNVVVTAVRAANNALSTLAARATPPTETALRNALLAVANTGIKNALPDVPPSAPDAVAILFDQAKSVSKGVAASLARVDAEDADFAMRVASPTPPDADARAQHFTSRVRLLLGNGFPMLPRFSVVNAPEVAASVAQRDSMNGGDAFAAHGWLSRIALVRPAVNRFARVLSAAEISGAATGDLSLIQLPFAPNDRWLALPLTDASSQAEVAIVAMWDGAVDPAKPMAGLFIDAWSEIIPSPMETTGVSFHYDAPGARAPQTILLAVPPDPSMTTWSFDVLLDTVLEAHDLGRIRAVGPKELTNVGVMLPCIYLPQSFSRDVPSVRFDLMAAKNLAGVTRVLGKN
jgi:hypothetical protein